MRGGEGYKMWSAGFYGVSMISIEAWLEFSTYENNYFTIGSKLNTFEDQKSSWRILVNNNNINRYLLSYCK